MDLSKTGLVGLVSETEVKEPKAAKKPAKPKTKAKKPAKAKKKTKAKPEAKAKKPAKAKRKPKASAGVVRTERLDMRLSKAEKSRIMAKATKLRRTVTSLVIEAIEKIK